MTLGQFAMAVGATPRWVLNALTRLKVRRRYDEPLARRLALARMLADTLDMPLPRAFEVAGRAVREGDPYGQWRVESPSGAVILVIDMPRFFTSYGARLAMARNGYDEKPRGRKVRTRATAMRRLGEYGFDTTLIAGQLARTPVQRVAELDQNLDFYRRVRVKE
jgi:hypothetical protein